MSLSPLPLDLFHTHSLSFSLTSLPTLSSGELALVQFHPDATIAQRERAQVLFVERRVAWLEQEKARLAAEEEVKPLRAKEEREAIVEPV